MELSKREMVMLLSGVAIAFLVQVLYDMFGTVEFYTSIMPKHVWGIVIGCGLLFLLWLYDRLGKE